MTSVLEMEDIYPSRVGDPPAVRERVDPVVYGEIETATDAPLDSEHLRHFDEQGFLFLKGFFAEEEVEIFTRALDTLRQSEVVKKAVGTITEPDSGEVRSVFEVHESSHLFKELARDRRLVEMMRYLLDSEVYIHQSRVNLKPGFKGKEFYWHSDFETWHVEDGMPRMRAISCSIALTDNYPFNGALMVMPGSHRHYIACTGETPEDNYKNSLKKQDIGVPDDEHLTWLADEFGIAMPTGPAGSVLLFDCNIMHGSNGNITPYSRSNVFMVYNSVENELVKPFCGLLPRPPFLGSRNCAPLTPAEPDYGKFA